MGRKTAAATKEEFITPDRERAPTSDLQSQPAQQQQQSQAAQTAPESTDNGDLQLRARAVAEELRAVKQEAEEGMKKESALKSEGTLGNHSHQNAVRAKMEQEEEEDNDDEEEDDDDEEDDAEDDESAQHAGGAAQRKRMLMTATTTGGVGQAMHPHLMSHDGTNLLASPGNLLGEGGVLMTMAGVLGGQMSQPLPHLLSAGQALTNSPPTLSSKQAQQKAKKQPWTEEEDRLVYALVQQYGAQKWTFIAQHIPGR